MRFISTFYRMNHLQSRVSKLQSKLAAISDPYRAEQMEAYMKHKFQYYGITSPSRKQAFKTIDWPKVLEPNTHFKNIINEMWHHPKREMQYCAMTLIEKVIKKLSTEDVPWLESLILQKSWWDTVDFIAPSAVGYIFKQTSPEKSKYLEKWMNSDNMWLNRSSIIFQLKYGKETDEDILSAAILAHDNSTEFFVRKAQGWSLRQYSKTNPQFVRQFIEANPQLSGLTKREAMKYV